jgi:hypothetical protein
MEALKTLNPTQCQIIKDGIEQSGQIGHYGRRFIAKAILSHLKKEEI